MQNDYEGDYEADSNAKQLQMRIEASDAALAKLEEENERLRQIAVATAPTDAPTLILPLIHPSGRNK